MFEALFENPGSKIKRVAIILFWIMVIASVILAFVFGMTETRYGRHFHLEYFFPIIIIGPLLAYVSTLFIIGFGDLVENTQILTEYTYKIAENSKKNIEVQNNAKLTVSSGWKCSCGRVNASYVSSCACGKTKSDNT